MNRTLKFSLITEEGAQYDYTISSTTLRVLSFRPDPPEEVSFIFHVDAIAQEENETLTLQLEPNSTIPTGRNVFFRNTINLTIIDNDGKRLVSVLSNYHAMSHCSFDTEVEIFYTNNDLREGISLFTFLAHH